MQDFLVRPLVFKLEGVGDMTRYTIVLADDGDTIYGTIGGDYAPTCGGYFPKHMLSQYEDKLLQWAYGDMHKHFHDFMYGWHGFLYMWGKQGDNKHRWDFLVLWLFAWLHMRGKTANTSLHNLVGEIYHDRPQNVLALIMAEIPEMFDESGTI